MRGAVIGALGALVLGVAGGYAAALATTPETPNGGTPAPVVASGPAWPTTPPKGDLPDSTLPPLATDLETHPEDLTLGTRVARVPVPDGWERLPRGDGHAAWVPPGNPDGSHSLRVRLMPPANQPPDQLAAALVAQIPLQDGIEDFEVVDEFDPETGTLVLEYTLNGYHKVQLSRWLTGSLGRTNTEIVAAGRLDDADGLLALLDQVTEKVRSR